MLNILPGALGGMWSMQFNRRIDVRPLLSVRDIVCDYVYGTTKSMEDNIESCRPRLKELHRG